MVDFTSIQLNTWLMMFVWPFCRLSGFMVIDPIFGHTSIPMKAKIGLAAVLTILVAPLAGHLPNVPVTSWAGILILCSEFAIGMAIGFMLKISLASVQAAGEFIAMQMSLSMATVYSPDTSTASSVISRFLYMIALLMFLALDGHLVLLEIIVDTFKALPVGTIMNVDAGKAVAMHAGTIFSAGLLLALPVVTTLLIVNLSMGILNRTAQQLSVFSIGFPITLLTGLLMMILMTYHYDDYLGRLFQESFEFTRTLLHLLTPSP
ncbi:flagellar biosynthetic protein FliR [Pseudomonas aeruginosa]